MSPRDLTVFFGTEELETLVGFEDGVAELHLDCGIKILHVVYEGVQTGNGVRIIFRHETREKAFFSEQYCLHLPVDFPVLGGVAVILDLTIGDVQNVNEGYQLLFESETRGGEPVGFLRVLEEPDGGFAIIAVVFKRQLYEGRNLVGVAFGYEGFENVRREYCGRV